MSPRRGIFRASHARRAVQIAFLLLFFGLIVLAGPGVEAESGPLLAAFFLADPLILVATWLAAHAVVPAMLWALVVVAITLLLGRVFCGWACPLGTIHDIAGRFFDGWQRHPKRRDQWSPWQRGKYYLLAGLLVMAALGCHWVTIMDPLVLLYRTTTTVLSPSAQWAVEEGATAVFEADPGVGSWRLKQATEPVYEFLGRHVFVVPGQAFLHTGLIAAVFVTIVLLNGYRRRFWCRYLCPLGALLGLLSWRPLLRRAVGQEDCNECGLCGMACHGAAAAKPGHEWKPAECFGCLNCTDSCGRDALAFRLVWPWRRKQPGEGIDLSKRATMGVAVGGLVTLAMLRANPLARGLDTETRYNPALLRPPGARPEREFLQRCTACGLCMKVCRTGGLQPALTEAGLEGLWTPRLVPRIGYCDHDCNLCGQICPTEAIRSLAIEEKQHTKIGLASLDASRCIPYAYGRECMVCEEHCPVPDKAIHFLEVEIRDRNGQAVLLKQPHVDPDLCIGCGVCEHVCVYQDQPAIHVFSTNETRHPRHESVAPADPWDGVY